jgi:hypothetical protein
MKTRSKKSQVNNAGDKQESPSSEKNWTGATATQSNLPSSYCVYYPLEANGTCKICQLEMLATSTTNNIEHHLRTSHGIELLQYQCGICHREWPSWRSVMTHFNRSNCRNERIRPETTAAAAAGTQDKDSNEEGESRKGQLETSRDKDAEQQEQDPHQPGETAEQGTPIDSTDKSGLFYCNLCAAGGWTKLAGLSQHKRRMHTSEYNASIEVATKKRRWTSDETLVLAELEASIPSSEGVFINQILAERFPSRTYEAIKSQRKRPDYRALVEEIRSRRPSRSHLGPAPSTCSSSNVHSSNNNNGSSQVVNGLHCFDEDNEQSPTPIPSPSPSTTAATAAAAAAATVGGGARTTTTTATGESRDCPKIRNYIRRNIIEGKLVVCSKMADAIQQYVESVPTISIVNLTLDGIHQALESVQKPPAQHQQKRQQGGSNDVGSKQRKSESTRTKTRQFAHYQQLFKSDRTKLASEIFDGVDTSAVKPSLTDAYEHFRTIWETTSKTTDAVGNDERLVEETGDVDLLLEPITREEIAWAIDQTSNQTAVGPDRVSLDNMKSIARREVWCAFNVWLGSRRIPDALKINRTALLPKGNEGLENIKNWRPITIASLLIRLYNKILARRMQRVFHINRKQTGFKPMNGVGQNTSLLHHLLRHARRNKNSIFVSLLDVSKAFDSVPHDSIKRALKRNGCPNDFIDLVVDQYHQITTSIAYGKESSREIKINRGVKQGDPMSSILFNLVIDELFETIGDRFGYEIAGVGSVNARAFADDIALVSGTEVGMQKLLSETEEFLSSRGLELNVKKCIAICLRKAGKVKKSQIADLSVKNPPRFVIKTEPIRLLGVNEQCRYLGVQYTPLGAVDARVPVSELKAALASLSKAPLKPQQKILMLRTHLIPRFIHAFTYTECYPKLIAQQDRLIRRWLKKTLRLPDSMTSDFFYLPTKEGGLGIGMLYNIIGAAKVRLHGTFCNAGDACLRYLVETEGSSMHARWCQAMKLNYRPSAADLKIRKKEIIDESRERYAQKVHGGGSEVFRASPMTNEWLTGQTRLLRGSTYIRAIQMRTNTIATRVSTTRGRNAIKTCRRCGLADETLTHILQTCPITQGMRCTRHNNVCRKVAEKLRAKGFQVFSEQGIPSPGLQTNISRPDLIAVRNEEALVLDVTCVYESTSSSLQDAYRRKVARYQSLAETIKHLYRVQSVAFHGLCLGSRGAYDPKHLAIWHSLGFSGNDLKLLAVGVIEDSLRTITLFNNANRLNV